MPCALSALAMTGRIVVTCCALVVLCVMAACQEEREPRKVEIKVQLTLKEGQWLYYSIADSTVLGYSVIGDAEQDAEWRGRKDWDIALSEYGIRTNSGTSGMGVGGIRLADSLTWSIDTLAVTVPVPLKE